jgi:hypothetical protein
VDSDNYHWVAHQAAVQRILRLSSRERKVVLDRIQALTDAPHLIEFEKGFTLSGEAPFYVLTSGKHILTFQLDHAVKELRLLAIE